MVKEFRVLLHRLRPTWRLVSLWMPYTAACGNCLAYIDGKRCTSAGGTKIVALDEDPAASCVVCTMSGDNTEDDDIEGDTTQGA